MKKRLHSPKDHNAICGSDRTQLRIRGWLISNLATEIKTKSIPAWFIGRNTKVMNRRNFFPAHYGVPKSVGDPLCEDLSRKEHFMSGANTGSVGVHATGANTGSSGATVPRQPKDSATQPRKEVRNMAGANTGSTGATKPRPPKKG
jgi:hypothetical protein